jgi:NAD(P)-dependent dehydrogenase (short-subunit alcohol dehydrogenase family)
VKKFEGKSVVVTGAGLGIGYALCRAFASEGATVALNDIDLTLAQEGARRINQEVGGEHVHAYSCDVADVEAVRGMFADFVAKTGHLDIAIANAGITNYGEFLEFTPQAFDRLTSVNLRGSFFTAQTAAKIMIEKQIAGRIVLMSSVTGVQAFLNLGAYGMTKAAIRMLARTIALEIGKYGITVNAIAPGAILTERTLQDDPDFEENWASVTPSGRAGYVEDIVAAALFLASPEARQVTGQTIVVDGGWTLRSPIPEGHPDKPEFSSQLR